MNLSIQSFSQYLLVTTIILMIIGGNESFENILVKNMNDYKNTNVTVDPTKKIKKSNISDTNKKIENRDPKIENLPELKNRKEKKLVIYNKYLFRVYE